MSDDPDYEALAELIERLERDSAALRELGAEAGVPAVERNAGRVAAAVRMLRKNVPPELYEDAE